jgi:hypothetical protein
LVFRLTFTFCLLSPFQKRKCLGVKVENDNQVERKREEEFQVENELNLERNTLPIFMARENLGGQEERRRNINKLMPFIISKDDIQFFLLSSQGKMRD